MRNLLTIVILIVTGCLKTYSQAPYYSFTYDKQTTGPDASSICKSYNEGTIFVGRFNGGMYAEIDSAGNPVWVKNCPNVDFKNVIRVQNKKYLFVGYGADSALSHYGVNCTMIDQYGNILWSRVYYDSLNPGNNARGFYVTECMDRNFVIGGFDYPAGFILKIDTLGNWIWSRRLTNNGDFATVECIRECSDSSLLISGNCSNSPAIGFFAKLDYSGNVIWAKSYSLGAYFYSGITSIEILSDGYILNAGFDGYGETVFKTDTTGNPIWSRNFRDAEGLYTSMSMFTPKSHLLSDSTYLLIAGSSNDNAGFSDIFQLDLNGDLLRKAEFLANPIDAYQKDDKSFVIMGHGPLNLVSPQYFSISQIELTHCDSTLGDSISPNVFCIREYPYMLQIDSTLIGEHGLSLLSVASFLNTLPGNTVTTDDTLFNNPGCVGFTGSVNEYSLHHLLIYPNPTQSKIQISSDELNGSYKMEVIDLSGRIILASKVEIVNGIFSREVSLENGIYYVKIFDESKIFEGQVVINK